MALQSGLCPSGLQINLGYNNISDKGAKAFAKALESGLCPSGLQINLGRNIGTEGAQAIALALESGKCPRGLRINLGSKISLEGIQAVATALESGNCPLDLQIGLEHNNIGDKGAEALARAIGSGRCRPGLQINLTYTNIGVEGIQALAKALETGQCPPGLHLQIKLDKDIYIAALEEVGAVAAKAFAKALASGQCPSGLQLTLMYNNIISDGDIGIQALTQALESGQCPAGLKINLVYNSTSNNAIAAAFAQAWKRYQQEQLKRECFFTLANKARVERAKRFEQENDAKLERLPKDASDRIFHFVFSGKDHETNNPCLAAIQQSLAMSKLISTIRAFASNYHQAGFFGESIPSNLPYCKQALMIANSGEKSSVKKNKIDDTINTFIRTHLNDKNYQVCRTIQLLKKFQLINETKILEDYQNLGSFKLVRR